MARSSEEIHSALVEAAETCFYRDGITATGVDAIAEEAGVSKRTLYNHFGSKDGLVAAYLERREQRWTGLLDGLLADAGGDAVEQVVAYAHAYARQTDEDLFRGCALINAAAELAEADDPALALIRASVDRVGEEITAVLVGGGLPLPEAARLAEHVVLVLEGAVAVGGIHRDVAPLFAATDVVRELVTAALTPLPAT
ncbi:TetR/AcrR family transcriptional regulator [Nocardioidaceae bacterium]|nr:TetR/AcrR family transcriptional regulator [Nocardioidaceae bacterium]